MYPQLSHDANAPTPVPQRDKENMKWVNLKLAPGDTSADLRRALRATVAFMAPLLVAMAGWASWDMSFVAIAAQCIALVDVRGDYRVRAALLLAMAGVFAGAAALGAAASTTIFGAILATGLMAVLGGLWRHLSGEYGPGLAISSFLVFLIALTSPQAHATVGAHALSALVGGLWGVLVQVAVWPFRPQHALRRTVADSWVAVADLCETLATTVTQPAPEAHERLRNAESAVRTALDHAYAALEVIQEGPLRRRLADLHLAGARLATRVTGLDVALGTKTSALTELAPEFEQVLTSLANLSRNAAVAVVSREPAQLAAFDVRTLRVLSLCRALRGRLKNDPANAQVAEIVRQIESLLPDAHDRLRETIERHDERGAFSLELADLQALALRPFASTLNFSLQIEPALLRFTLRLAALTMFGVFAFKLLELPHGYWLPFTLAVVLQPDYGSTRERAGQRLFGTVAGSILASALLFLRLPFAAIMGATAATLFAFGFLVKRNYGIAIFFVTLFIVLLTEAAHPVTFAFTAERLTSTLAGGVLAWLAAFIFWPVWERDRLPAILARTFEANRDYLRVLMGRLTSGGSFDPEAISAKRRVEGANNAAFASLKRMGGDPHNKRDGLEHAATLVNGNQRLTRLLNAVALHLMPGTPLSAPAVSEFASHAESALDQLARVATGAMPPPSELERLTMALEGIRFPSRFCSDREQWVFAQLTRATMELSALVLAVQTATPPSQTDAGYEGVVGASTGEVV